MTTLQIQIDENVAAAIREKAQRAGKSPEAWAAEALALDAGTEPGKEWIDKLRQLARSVEGNPDGWKWNREELYDR